ncbi:heavy metal-associated isoprenylated plant protein 9-like [Iris pallida]|uniref:Heavy metal-associated isoprenylated plant protein 9-like n=1 Tax=Iris pallida TaxID=29817 RepID=A0AAX6GND9_IRIPA|nr:heavy metal-associated isoprenylated plant protein 9-like [Iris pallida]
MGEAKQEETKADAKPAEEKKEEKAEEKKEEAAKAEEKKEEAAKPSPPQPIVLSMDLHCVGCAKKIERCIMRCKGVEEVETDMNQNKVTVKGMADPQALCARIQKKTMRTAKVLSPLPPPEAVAADSAASPEVAAQASGMTTVELQVNMHCEACAQQLQRKILKMKGVQTAETDLSSGKVKVTGTMTAERLVVDIYRRTGKLASVIPPPPPPPPPTPKEEEKKEEGEKKAEAEKPPEEEKKEEKGGGGEEEKKKEEEKAAEQPKDGDKAGEAKEGEKGGGEEAKKEAEPAGPAFVGPPEDMMMKRMMYWNNGYFGEEEMAKRMIMAPAAPPPWMHTPVYFIQPPPPPPQFFSDENPNACCIS